MTEEQQEEEEQEEEFGFLGVGYQHDHHHRWRQQLFTILTQRCHNWYHIGIVWRKAFSGSEPPAPPSLQIIIIVIVGVIINIQVRTSVSLFLASQDALEVMIVTESLSE